MFFSFQSSYAYPALPLIGKSWPNLECKNQSFNFSELSKLTDFFIPSLAKIFQSGAVQGVQYFYIIEKIPFYSKLLHFEFLVSEIPFQQTHSYLLCSQPSLNHI